MLARLKEQEIPLDSARNIWFTVGESFKKDHFELGVAKQIISFFIKIKQIIKNAVMTSSFIV